MPFGRFGDNWSKDRPILSLAVVLLSKTSASTSPLEGCGNADSSDACVSRLKQRNSKDARATAREARLTNCSPFHATQPVSTKYCTLSASTHTTGRSISGENDSGVPQAVSFWWMKAVFHTPFNKHRLVPGARKRRTDFPSCLEP